MAIILRHRPKGEWKSLYIAKIPEPTMQITKENNPTLLLSFDENRDFLAWEQKLREHLKGEFLEGKSFQIWVSKETTHGDV